MEGAAQRLADYGLIEAKELGAEATGPGLVRITTDGRRCVESDLSVDEWVDRGRMSQPTSVYNFNGQFHGTSVSPAAATSRSL